MLKKILTVLVLIFAPKIATANPVVVEVAEFAPCVFVDKDGKPSGFDIELWEAVAKDAGIDYVYKPTKFANILPDVAAKKADVGISGITVTNEREKSVDFSHHYMDSGLMILIRDNGKKNSALFDFFASFWKAISSNAVVQFGLCLFVFYLLMAHIVWIAERNNGLDGGYLRGVFNAFYFCIVTSSTVGYGDITAKKIVGRVCSIVLIIFGIMIFSNFTALLAANYTVEKLDYAINGPDDLKGKLVATQVGTTSEEYLKKLGANVVALDDIAEAYAKLADGSVDAVVYDSPSIMNYAKDMNGKLTTVGGTFDKQYYGFALQQASPLQERINQSLLKLRQDGTYDEIYTKWFNGGR